MKTYTISGKNDGFGAQYLAIMSGIAFCKYKNYKYVHTNIKYLEHSLNVDFINKFVGIPQDISYNNIDIIEEYSFHVHTSKNPDMFYTNNVVDTFRKYYYSTKKPIIKQFDIVIHIRRGDVTPYKNADRYVPNIYYVKLINYFSKRFNHKITIFSQGKLEDFNDFKGKNVNFYITDYGKLSKNAEKMEEGLKRYGIGYMRKPADNWVDCSNVRQHKRSVSRLKQVFKECCAKTYYTLLNGRLYTCPFIANAANLKALPDNKADYVDLFSEKKENLKNRISRLINMDGFFPACDFCDGRPNDPTTAKEYAGKGFIKAAIQTSEEIPFTKYK